jgi:hypothetical protein
MARNGGSQKINLAGFLNTQVEMVEARKSAHLSMVYMSWLR